MFGSPVAGEVDVALEGDDCIIWRTPVDFYIASIVLSHGSGHPDDCLLNAIIRHGRRHRQPRWSSLQICSTHTPILSLSFVSIAVSNKHIELPPASETFQTNAAIAV